MSETVLQVDSLRKSFADGTVAIDGVSVAVREGEFVTVVGPSGCGKTTLLRCIAGLEPASDGEVRFRGATVVKPPDGMAVVFQEYGRSLLPWLNVLDNIMLPLRRKERDKHRRRQRAEDALWAVGLSEFGRTAPWQLSGGMQQRVALARALAYGADVLLMDEPFASVDAQTRSRLEDLVLQVRRDFKLSVVLVTHDVDESVYLGDRVIVMSRRPSRIRCTVEVDLPPPRHQVITKELGRFVELRSFVAREIEDGAAQVGDLTKRQVTL